MAIADLPLVCADSRTARGGPSELDLLRVCCVRGDFVVELPIFESRMSRLVTWMSLLVLLVAVVVVVIAAVVVMEVVGDVVLSNDRREPS